MKKLIPILLLVFAFTLNTQSQRKERKVSVDKMLKKMTKDLNLTEAQQSKIKPLLEAQIADRKALNKKRKAIKEAGEKPSREERMKMRKERMKSETAMNTKMATILDKDQLVKFKELAKKRKQKTKDRMKKQ